MNKKALTWSTIAGIVLMIVIVTILLIGINRGIAMPLFKFNSCPLPEERCLSSCENTGLTVKTIESTTKHCKADETICCMTPEEITGTTKVKSIKEGAGGTGTGGSGAGGSGAGGTGTIGNPGDVDIRIEKSDDQSVRFTSGQTITLKQGDVLKIDTWIESGKNGEKYCSVNLRDVTNGLETGFIINPIPNWFAGTITREECFGIAKKRHIEVKYDSTSVGKKFKMDIMAASSTDTNQRFTGSASLFIVMAPQQGTTNTNPGIAGVTLNGAQISSPLSRKGGDAGDEFKITTTNDAKYCKVKLTNEAGEIVPNSPCIVYSQEAIQDCTRYNNFKIYYDELFQGTTCTGRFDSDGTYINNIVPEKLNVAVTFYKDAEGTQVASETAFTINVATLRGDGNIHVVLNGAAIGLGYEMDRTCGDSGTDTFVIWEEQVNSKKCSYIRGEDNADTNLASEIISGGFISPQLCHVKTKKTVILNYPLNSCNNALMGQETGNMDLKISLDSGSSITLATVVVNQG
ncbi:MAG: hypothetical protein ACP5N2_06790 [Candidatus Nanoarchaeia archaeon]